MFFFRAFIEFLNSVLSLSIFGWLFVFPVLAFLIGVIYQLVGGRRR